MNNKEFISEMSQRLGYNAKETSTLISGLIHEMTKALEDEKCIAIPNVGSFEVKKKNERIIVNPGTHQRMLVPPKLAISFKPSTTLKDKIQ